jgi:hypothetical protein
MGDNFAWAEAYRAYRRIPQHLVRLGKTDEDAAKLADQLLNCPNETAATKLMQSFNVNENMQEDFEHVLEVRQAFSYGLQGLVEAEPLPNVYAAALAMRRDGEFWKADPNKCLYRGQRNHTWDVVPSIFRSQHEPSLVEQRWKRLLDWSVAVKREYETPEHPLTNEQCLAAAQHFSGEAQTPTTLIDVTFEPMVALFFASLNGKPGEIGVVDRISVGEWEYKVASAPGDPGFIRVIAVDEVHRIRHQRARFLDAPNSDLYKRYYPSRLYFKQTSDPNNTGRGLTFRDLEMTEPIDEKYLLHIEPRMQERIRDFNENPGKYQWKGDRIPHPTQSVFDAALLSRRAEVLEPILRNPTPDVQIILAALCETYVQAPTIFPKIPRWRWSVHSFEDCVCGVANAVRSGKTISLREALCFVTGGFGSEINLNEFFETLKAHVRI